MDIRTTTLESGLTVITDSFSSVRSLAVGIWSDVGSRDEMPHQAGMAHFMEHMAFKGTPTRDAVTISEGFDRLGAVQNAFTSKEVTCYHAKCIDESATGVVQILADMVASPKLEEADCALEREVIIEEIARSGDDPEDIVHELLTTHLWPEHPLGLPIGGTPDTVSTFGHDITADFHASYYVSGNTLVTAAGNVDHDELVSRIERELAPLAAGSKRAAREVPTTGHTPLVVRQKDTEQAHLIFGTGTMAASDDRREALAILSTIFGGSMSSRLFREVREKLGLVYAVYSFPQLYADAGMLGVYAGTRPGNAEKVRDVVMREWARLGTGDVTQDEFDLAMAAIKGSMAMGLESTTKRMRGLGRGFLHLGAPVTFDESIARLEAVTLADVRLLGAELGSSPVTISAVGPLEQDLTFAGKQERS